MKNGEKSEAPITNQVINNLESFSESLKKEYDAVIASRLEDPRVKRRLFSWRMFLLILLIVVVLSVTNVLLIELLLKFDVVNVAMSMGVGSYWVMMALVAAVVIHQVTCTKFDKPMRKLSRAMRKVAGGDFSVSLAPMHPERKLDYMDIMFEDFNRMVSELASTAFGHQQLCCRAQARRPDGGAAPGIYRYYLFRQREPEYAGEQHSAPEQAGESGDHAERQAV